jgi:hypothetical protein
MATPAFAVIPKGHISPSGVGAGFNRDDRQDPNGGGSGLAREAERSNLQRSAAQAVLRAWVIANLSFPCPTAFEREALAEACGVSPAFLEEWFQTFRETEWQQLLSQVNQNAPNDDFGDFGDSNLD